MERGPVTNLDNKLLEEEETNKLTRSSSIAEKTAKLHRLLGDSDKEKGFHLGEISYKAKLDYGNLEIFLSSDLESPESEKLTDSVSEKEEKDIDELEEDEKEKDLCEKNQCLADNEPGLPVKRRQKKWELPAGWERHEVGLFCCEAENLVSVKSLQTFIPRGASFFNVCISY